MNERIVIRSGLFLLMAIFIFSACKKDEPEEVEPDSSAVQQLSSDDKYVEETTDEVMEDASHVLAGSKNDHPCNASLDTITLISDTLVFHVHYYGLNCDQTWDRHGWVLVKIKLNTQWHEKGAFIVVEYVNYQAKNTITNANIMLNGKSVIENVSGGTIPMIGQGITHVVHKNESFLNVKFNGNPPRSWNLTKRLLYSGQQGNLTLSVEGYGKADGYDNLTSWGTDRDGKIFYTQISQTVVFPERCFWIPNAGIMVYNIPGEGLTATAEYGYNANNNPVPPGACGAKYKLTWQQHGQSGTIFLPLY